MNNTVKNIAIVIGGLVIGNIAIMAVMYLGNFIIDWPLGVDPKNIESIKNNLHLFQPHHFIFPFLSHAIGALGASYFVAKLVSNNQFRLSMTIGCIFLAAGIMNIFMLKHPLWFIFLDLTLAYIPMAYLGYKLASK
jgi:hypothetical protein